MKKLLITLMLISPFSFADWGDVYYCQMTTHSLTILEGERTDYQLEKFQFKLDKTKNAMVFGNTGHFKDQSFLLSADMTNDKDPEFVTTQALLLQMEIWYANSEDSNTKFSKGKFLYASVSSSGVQIISADCDKF